MLKVVRENFVINDTEISYQLENGLMLLESDCNGKCYVVNKVAYTPVTAWVPKEYDGMEYDTLEVIGFNQGS